MNFKKDYINYVLYNIVSRRLYLQDRNERILRSEADAASESESVRKVLETIISSADLVKITYLIGKTAGLELLYKYLLYISDKIDKSQITIFNIKDNFEYDLQNLSKICRKINEITARSSVRGAAKVEAAGEEQREDELVMENIGNGTSDALKVEEIGYQEEEKSEILESKEFSTQEREVPEEEPDPGTAFTLVGNEEEKLTTDSEVFELPDISQPPELEDRERSEEEISEKEHEVKSAEDEEPLIAPVEETETEPAETGTESLEKEEKEEAPEQPQEITEPFEFEVKTPEGNDQYGFERTYAESGENNLEKLRSRFFEEIKILEKLLFHIEKDFKDIKSGSMRPSISRRLSEIMQLSGELSQLTKRLSLEDISKVFFLISLYCSKVSETPGIITKGALKLLLNSLEMVNVLLKEEQYSKYEQMIKKVDDLIDNLSRKPESRHETEAKREVPPEKEEMEPVSGIELPVETKAEVLEPDYSGYPKQMVEVPDEVESPATGEEMYAPVPEDSRETETVSAQDSANFKMRYLVKEFEKEFLSMNEIQGDYIKFDALDKIDTLNNSLRIIARIASSVQTEDVLKLAEVSYVFLKYLKDYRMDVLDPEIQQIIKYIIFTFKMLLTDRKPEDFDILVQYLNNPVKIFTDS